MTTKRANMFRLLMAAGILAVLAATFFVVKRYSDSHEVVKVEYERREIAKDFDLPVIGKSRYFPTEERVTLTSARKTPVLIHFLASWCSVCREEKPALDEFWDKHKDKDILVLGVASSDTKQAMDASGMIKDPTFAVVLDEDGSTANAYKVPALPVSVLVGADGYIVKTWKGAMSPYDISAIEVYLEGLKKAH